MESPNFNAGWETAFREGRGEMNPAPSMYSSRTFVGIQKAQKDEFDKGAGFKETIR